MTMEKENLDNGIKPDVNGMFSFAQMEIVFEAGKQRGIAECSTAGYLGFALEEPDWSQWEKENLRSCVSRVAIPNNDMEQKSLSGQLIELGYEGNTFNYWEIKEWLWCRHEISITKIQILEDCVDVWIKDENKEGVKKIYVRTSDPISAEIQGITSAVSDLYSQTAVGC